LPYDPYTDVGLCRQCEHIAIARLVRQQDIGFAREPPVQRGLFDCPAPIGNLRLECDQAANGKRGSWRDHGPQPPSLGDHLGGEQTRQKLVDLALKDSRKPFRGLCTE